MLKERRVSSFEFRVSKSKPRARERKKGGAYGFDFHNSSLAPRNSPQFSVTFLSHLHAKLS